MEQPISPSTVRTVSDRSGRAVASLVLGIIGLFAWMIPFLGLPIQIIGLVLGIQARASTKRGLAIAGITLSIIGIVLSVISGLSVLLILLSLGDVREKAQGVQDIYNSVTPLP